jgi:hypothetical protein
MDMATERARDISKILSDPNVVLQAASEAAQDAIQRHKQMGLPLAVWKDGAVAWVAPEELERMMGEDMKKPRRSGTPWPTAEKTGRCDETP